MRSRIFVPEDWQAVVGTAVLAFGDVGARRVTVDFVSTGANIYLETESEDGECSRLLMFSGFGSGSVAFIANASSFLRIDQEDGAHTSVRIPELRAFGAGWRRTASFTDLEPKRPGAVSPEVQAVIDQMNRNAIIRETKLLAALDKRR